MQLPGNWKKTAFKKVIMKNKFFQNLHRKTFSMDYKNATTITITANHVCHMRTDWKVSSHLTWKIEIFIEEDIKTLYT